MSDDSQTLNSITGTLKQSRTGFIFIFLLSVTLVLFGCGGSPNSPGDTGSNIDLNSPTPVISALAEGQGESSGNGTVTTPSPTSAPAEAVSLDHVLLNPATTELDIGQTQVFIATAVDADDNPIPEAQITWEITGGMGSINNEGTVTSGTKAGTFENGITAVATLGDISAKASATVTVKPGPVASLEIAPIEVIAGETQQLKVIATDKYGNQVADLEGNWTIIDGNAGTLTDSGLLTAAEVAGFFDDAVKVEVAQGAQANTAVAPVKIVPGPLDQVVIAPNPADIGIKMNQQFVAVGADQYGNRIAGLPFEWSVEKEGGTIDENGLFTAGTKPSTYKDTVKAVAEQGDINRSAVATVTVEPDRIAFISDRNNDQPDIYIMDADGSNIKRLTNTSGSEFSCSWSPDGRRILYDSLQSDGGIIAMNDDGKWGQLLIGHGFDSIHMYPSWSPNGSKIVFITYSNINGEDIKDWDVEVFVMDVDGGNLTQLTDTPNVTELSPTWSPDGTKIAYVYVPDIGDQDIFVMNADGSNPKQITMSAGTDMAPAWSPDGSKIAFESYRFGDYDIYVANANGTDDRRITHTSGTQDTSPSWSPDGSKIAFVSNRDIPDKDNSDSGEIYVMNATGGDATRLTNDLAIVDSPCWAPRKAGIEVTEASVVIPNTSKLRISTTVQQATANAQEAVVKIKTDLDTGSGFIIDPDGLILTNNHVIVDAEEVTVYLNDGTSYKGTVKNRDMVQDLAVVEINAKDLPYLVMGDVGQLSLGQQVLVLGYPLDSENVNPTSGIVSSVEFDGGRGITWVKTDSAVNPGNSGGPLLNLQGQVVGIVSAKVVGVAVEGVGYAISANSINGDLPRLLADSQS